MERKVVENEVEMKKMDDKKKEDRVEVRQDDKSGNKDDHRDDKKKEDRAAVPVDGRKMNKDEGLQQRRPWKTGGPAPPAVMHKGGGRGGTLQGEGHGEGGVVRHHALHLGAGAGGRRPPENFRCLGSDFCRALAMCMAAGEAA